MASLRLKLGREEPPAAVTATPLAVAVIADSPLARQRLQKILARNFRVLGATARFNENVRPDVLVIEVDGGVTERALQRAGNPDIPVVLLTREWPDVDHPISATRALGVLPRAATAAQINAAVAAVAEKLSVFTPRIHPAPKAPRHRHPQLVEALTERETAVLGMVAAGLHNKAIAEELGISGHTVKYHVSSLFGKLGVASRAEAVLAGIQNGLILL